MNTAKGRNSRIRADLRWLCSEFDRLNKQHIYDIERSAERFFCGLLNLVTDCDLILTNRFDKNYPDVDLMDLTAGLAVKVIPSFTKAQVTDALAIFCRYHLANQFSRFILLTPASAARKPLPEIDQTNPTPEFIDLWDSKALIAQILSLPDEKRGAIEAYLANYITARASQPRYPLPPLPHASDHFIVGSRDTELAALGQKLKSRNPLFVWGLGGIGKTQIAIQLAKLHTPPRGVYFIRCVPPADPNGDVLRGTILAADFSGYRFEGIDSENREQEYQARLALLKQDYAGAMLIFDNLDCGGKTVEQLRQEQTYRDLAALDLQLVFTTRNSAPGESSLEAGPLSEQSLLRLMRSHIYSEEYSDEELLPLIRAAGSHTLMVDLMARILETSWGEVTPENLLETLEDSTLEDNQFPEVASDYNRRYEQQNIYAHLKALFNLSGLTDSARNTLQYATLLPEDGMDEQLFLNCLPDGSGSSLLKLINRGWIQHHGTNLSIHPVVREVCLGELDPTDENCGPFLQRLWNQYNLRTEFQNIPFRQVAQCFSMASDKLADEQGQWAYYAGLYWNTLNQPRTALPYLQRALKHSPRDIRRQNTVGIAYRELGNYPKALEYQEQVLVTLKSTDSSPALDRAIAYSNIGTTHYTMGNSEKALEYQLKALEIREEKLPANPLQLANAYNNAGITYGDLNNHRKALEFQLKALAIREKELPPDHPDLAQSHSNVGITYVNLGDYKKALTHQLKALDTSEQELDPEDPALARAYSNVGITYTNLGDHDKALEYQLKALEIREKELPPDHPDMATSFNNIGRTYGAMGDYGKALEYHLKALEIREKELPDHPDLALSYNNVSSTYISMKQYEDALKYALKALEIREKVLPPKHPHLAASYSTVGRIYCALSQYDKALIHQQHATQLFEKVLPPKHPDLAISYSNIALTYASLEKYQHALEYLEKALEILERQLPPGHPHIASVRQNLDFVRRLAAQ